MNTVRLRNCEIGWFAEVLHHILSHGCQMPGQLPKRGTTGVKSGSAPQINLTVVNHALMMLARHGWLSIYVELGRLEGLARRDAIGKQQSSV